MRTRKSESKLKMKIKELGYNWKRVFRSPFTVIGLIVIAIDCFLLVYGLFWAGISSLKSINNFYDDMFGWPKTLRFDNYQTAVSCFYASIKTGAGYKRVYFWGLLWNSILFSTFPVIIEVVSTACVAYVCCKYKRKFNKVIYFIVMFVLVFPGVSAVGNQIAFTKAIGLYDNYIFMCYGFIGFAKYNFLVWTGTFQNIPDDFLDAARIDGAGNWRIMLTIAFPLARIPLFIFLLQGFIVNWNSYMAPLTTMPSYPNLAYALFTFKDLRTNVASFPPIQLASSLMVAIPCIVLYSIMSPYMIGNLTAGGLKG